MGPSDLSSTIGRRFHRPPVPSAIACLQSKDPITFSHVANGTAMSAPTLAPPVENAFAVHVHHAPLFRGDIWIQGGHRRMPVVPVGGVFVFDLRTEPVAQVHEPFEFSRFQISRATMDELAFEHGIGRLGDLRAQAFEPDPVLRHLAQAMLHRVLHFGPESETLFSDGIALAFFAHIGQKYAGITRAPVLDGVLAPWQMRRLTEWVEAHLDGSVSIADLAGLANLSRTHFARMFRRSFGTSPHQWLLSCRIDRAKKLLKGPLPLAAVAAMCGFVDQSHFTKVFTRLEGVTPGSWRRQLQ